jgi:hypothetical protein
LRTSPPNVQIFEDPPINDYQVKGAVFGTSLDKVEKDNIYMLYEGRHNSLPSVVSSQGQTAEYA